MYNAHNYAISIERLLKLPAQTANEIEKNPLAYLKHLLNWEEADAAQMVKDLREIFS